MGARNRAEIGLSHQPARSHICKRLWSPGIDSEESSSPAYVAWRAGTKNRVVVPAARLESIPGLLNRSTNTGSGYMGRRNRFPGSINVYKKPPWHTTHNACLAFSWKTFFQNKRQFCFWKQLLCRSEHTSINFIKASIKCAASGSVSWILRYYFLSLKNYFRNWQSTIDVLELSLWLFLGRMADIPDCRVGMLPVKQ